MRRYVEMLADRRRVDVFRKAVAAVAPGKVLADIGCGLGTYAFAARRAGARAVYAVEADRRVLDAAEAIARASGIEGITFLHGDSRFLEAPGAIDVVVYEDFRLLAMDAEVAEVLRDLRRRWLRPGGTVVPGRVEIMVAPVSAEPLFGREQEAVAVAAAGGLDIAAVCHRARNEIHAIAGRPEWLLGPSARVATIDLARDERFDVDGAVEVTVEKQGFCRGLLGWFRLHLAEGLLYDTGPEAGPNAWGGQAVLPVTEPWAVEPGNVLRIQLAGLDRPSGYYWRWRLALEGRVQEMTTWAVGPDPVVDGRAQRAAAARLVLSFLSNPSESRRRQLQILCDHWPGEFPSDAAAIRFLEDIEQLLRAGPVRT